MEEKKFERSNNSLWPFFGSRQFNHAFSRRLSGITLVELLVVVSLIGILLATLFLILNPVGQFQKANDARRKSDLTQIQKALETYFNDNGKYPPSSVTYRIVRLDGTTADWGKQFTPYMATLPIDPKSSKRTYVYFAPSNRQSYWLYASLERNNDRQLCNFGNPCPSLTINGIPTSSCGDTCNFALTSSNVIP